MKNKITIRISDDLRDQLDEKAQLEGVSTSELTRTILDEFCNPLNGYDEEGFVENDQQMNEVSKNEVDYEEECNSDKNELFELGNNYEVLKSEYEELEEVREELENIDIVYSVEFLQLVCWVYYQRSTLRISLPDEQYKNFQSTIIKIHSSKVSSKELKNEFNKVFADLVKVEGNMFLKHSQLDFSKGVFPKFNYALLNDFIFHENCGIKTVNI